MDFTVQLIGFHLVKDSTNVFIQTGLNDVTQLISNNSNMHKHASVCFLQECFEQKLYRWLDLSSKTVYSFHRYLEYAGKRNFVMVKIQICK